MLEDTMKEIWLKLLKAEVRHRTKKIQKHERRLMQLEMELKRRERSV